jgi:hypothetical protein
MFFNDIFHVEKLCSVNLSNMPNIGLESYLDNEFMDSLKIARLVIVSGLC